MLNIIALSWNNKLSSQLCHDRSECLLLYEFIIVNLFYVEHSVLIFLGIEDHLFILLIFFKSSQLRHFGRIDTAPAHISLFQLPFFYLVVKVLHGKLKYAI